MMCPQSAVEHFSQAFIRFLCDGLDSCVRNAKLVIKHHFFRFCSLEMHLGAPHQLVTPFEDTPASVH